MKISFNTKILVRFDDICPTMDFSQFEKAVCLMDSYGVKPLIGIIPDNCDSDLFIEKKHNDFWNYIKKLQRKGYAIAMHGYKHVFDTNERGLINSTFKSEFAGHSLEEQIIKIQKGKAILEGHGIYTDIFFAPAHSYNDDTIKALKVCGFKYMSDSKSSLPYVRHGIKLLPIKPYNIFRFIPLVCTTAVFHAHEWSWKEKSKDFDVFTNLLKNYSANIVTFEDFSKIPNGLNIMQRIEEFLFVIYERHIHGILSKFYHFFK